MPLNFFYNSCDDFFFSVSFPFSFLFFFFLICGTIVLGAALHKSESFRSAVKLFREWVNFEQKWYIAHCEAGPFLNIFTMTFSVQGTFCLLGRFVRLRFVKGLLDYALYLYMCLDKGFIGLYNNHVAQCIISCNLLETYIWVGEWDQCKYYSYEKPLINHKWYLIRIMYFRIVFHCAFPVRYLMEMIRTNH